MVRVVVVVGGTTLRSRPWKVDQRSRSTFVVISFALIPSSPTLNFLGGGIQGT